MWQKNRCVSIAKLIQDVVWFENPAYIGKGVLAHKSESSTSKHMNQHKIWCFA